MESNTNPNQKSHSTSSNSNNSNLNITTGTSSNTNSNNALTVSPPSRNLSTPGEKFTKIHELRPSMRGINIIFIVLEKGKLTRTKEGHFIAHAWVADNTASISLSLWDTQAEWLNCGDILRLRGGYASLFKNYLILYSGRYGFLERIGHFTLNFVETPNMSQTNWSDQNTPLPTT